MAYIIVVKREKNKSSYENFNTKIDTVNFRPVTKK